MDDEQTTKEWQIGTILLNPNEKRSAVTKFFNHLREENERLLLQIKNLELRLVLNEYETKFKSIINKKEVTDEKSEESASKE